MIAPEQYGAVIAKMTDQANLIRDLRDKIQRLQMEMITALTLINKHGLSDEYTALRVQRRMEDASRTDKD